jgi:glycosyltransferase involved in cell wall biosynthesis
MRILFLAPYPVKEAASQRYRFEHYLPYLESRGIQYSYKPFLGNNTWKIFFKPGNVLKKITGLAGGYLRRWLLMFTIPGYDYVYIHREAAPIGPPVFEWIIARLYRKKIIYDFDDAIWIPFSSQYNKMPIWLRWFQKAGAICKWSYKVSTGNEYLAAFARKYNKNVVVVPTVVNTDLTHNRLQEHETAHPVIGWTGTFSTLKYIDIVLPVLQKLQERYDFPFLVIADVDPQLPLKNYRFIRWKKETEAEDLLQMHIGLMPLYDDEMSRGKCGFKAIQYMSLGIPPVVSPVGVNSTIVDDMKNGFICTDPEEWKSTLEKLLIDATLRQQIGRAARQKIELAYSVHSTLDSFIGLFSSKDISG